MHIEACSTSINSAAQNKATRQFEVQIQLRLTLEENNNFEHDLRHHSSFFMLVNVI